MTTSLRGAAFFEKIEAVLGTRVSEYVRAAKVRDIDTLIRWLKQHAKEHFDGKLGKYAGEVYPHLLQFVHTHAPNQYEPESFWCEQLSVEVWVLCANTYGTVGKLRMALRETPHLIPRKDVYLALMIGVLDAHEFTRVRPKLGTRTKRPALRMLDIFENTPS